MWVLLKYFVHEASQSFWLFIWTCTSCRRCSAWEPGAHLPHPATQHHISAGTLPSFLGSSITLTNLFSLALVFSCMVMG